MAPQQPHAKTHNARPARPAAFQHDAIEPLPPIPASPSDLAHRAVLCKLLPQSIEQIAARLGRLPSVQRDHAAIAEFGVHHGGSFQHLLPHALEHDLTIFAVDSFEGMGEPGPRDGGKYPKGRLSVNGPDTFTRRFGMHTNVRVFPGFIPDVLARFDALTRFAFVHLDVDHYQPTVDVLNFIWDRMLPGAIVAVHDYFPGRTDLTTPAVDEFLDRHALRHDGLESTVVWFTKP